MIDSKFLLFAAIAFLSAHCPADEDNLDQSWPSPSRQYLVRHTTTFDRHDTSRKRNEDAYDQPAAYILTREGKVLWQMESPVDESAHDFHCVWASDSKSALVLDRPCRGDVEMSLILPGTLAKSGPLALQRTIDTVIKKAGEDDARHLQKAWFGQWRFADGRYEGIVIVAQVHYHRLHFVLAPFAKSPKLKLLDTITFQTWDEAMEAF